MPAKRYTVRVGDGATLGKVLVRAGADADALRQGRVFLGRRRALRNDEVVHAGDVIHIASVRPVAATVRVLLRTEDMVAVDKPAGVPTIPDQSGAAHALVSLVSSETRINASRLHATSRLDRDVSGVVVFALTKGARERLLRARADGVYERRYVALAAHSPEPERGVWDARVGRARDPRRRIVGGRDALDARTLYEVCARVSHGFALLCLVPVTGRTHQIRVHAAHAGAPLVGDRAYGGPARLTLPGGRVLELRRVALHAARVTVPDARGSLLVVAAEVPRELREIWYALGGGAPAWDLCTSCELGSS